MRKEYVQAVNLLASLKAGDVVEFTEGSKGDRTYAMNVSRTMHRSDGAFGSYESNRVTVTYGPGRYSREITADQIVHDQATITAVHRGDQQIFGA